MLLFFFKQKTAYDMRISDWSSDVCSSDLIPARIFWGWLAGSHVEPRRLLAVLGCLMAVAAALTASLRPTWPLSAVIAVAVMFSSTAVSWHGVIQIGRAHV